MYDKLQVFENEEFGKVRALEIDGQPWFVGKDVAGVLGYGEKNKSSKALNNAVNDHVDAEDKGVTKMDTPGGKQNIVIINESGLYSLIMHSKLPTAKRFKRWVTAEVLPSIRKHGAYVLDELLDIAEKNQDFAFALFRKLQTEKGKTAALRDKVEALEPKARYYDLILQSDGVVQVSVIAKDYGMSAVAFNRLLHDLRIQYRVGGTWLLYQKLAGQGYTHSRTYYTTNGAPVVHTYWTQKGRIFLYDTLKEAGVVPTIEATDATGFFGFVNREVN